MSYATTKWVNEKLLGLKYAIAMARRNKMGVWNALDNGVKAGPFEGADQSGQIDGLHDRVQGSGHGGREHYPSSIYTLNDGTIIPVNLAVLLEGEGSGWRSNLGRGTTFQRRANPAVVDSPMISCLAIGATDSERSLARLKGLRLRGGADIGVTDGTGLALGGPQEGNPLIDDVRLEQFPGTAAFLNNVFNCSIDHFRVTHSGSATDTKEACRIAGTPNGGTVTLNGYDWQFEQNSWTDLRIGGEPDFANGFVTEFNLFGAKFEGGLDVEAPYIHYAFCEISNLYGIGIFSHRSVPSILVEHMQLGPGEDQPVNQYGWIAQAPSVASPDYFIDVQGGNLHYHGGIRGTPGVAHVRIGANVRPGNFTFDGQVFDFNGTTSTPAELIVEDNRTNPEF
jgi:hypothetical protein